MGRWAKQGKGGGTKRGKRSLGGELRMESRDT